MLDIAQVECLKSIDWGDFGRTRSEEAAEKKKQLLEMARNGEPKPHRTQHPLGKCFAHYIDPNSTCYDDNFRKLIESISPCWLATVDAKKAENKQQLIEMARRGEPRPVQKNHHLGQIFWTYTNPKHSAYCFEFCKQIYEIAPAWRQTKMTEADDKRQQLLQMAREGKPKPHHKKHPLGKAFNRYMDPTSDSYRPDFCSELRCIAPQWFVTPSDIANEKKQQLLEMARRGEPRPKQRDHSLGAVLCAYTNPKNACYDPEFDKQIRKLAPHWFKKK